ncbi:MAG: TetR/AcrR family transcriptional regulator [Pseudomonadota bacterium]
MKRTERVLRKSGVGQRIKNEQLVEKRRQQISDAAMRLFAKNGYHNTTVRDIARLSKISTGSIYDYIKNKEDILFLVSKNFFDNLQREVEKAVKGLDDPLMKLRAAIEATLTVIDRFQEYVLITYRESKYFKRQDLMGIFQQEDFFIDIFLRIMEEGSQKGLFQVREPFVVANLLTLMSHCWALKRYKLKEYSLFSFKETLIELVLEGIGRKDVVKTVK